MLTPLHPLLPPCSKAVKSWIAERSVQRAVVVGAGFIGMEMAENLVHLGIETHVVEMGPQVGAGAAAGSSLMLWNLKIQPAELYKLLGCMSVHGLAITARSKAARHHQQHPLGAQQAAGGTSILRAFL